MAELVVTGPSAPAVKTLDGRASASLHVRPSSSYYEHPIAVNAARVVAGQPALQVVAALQDVAADDALDDYDLAEPVDVGVVPAVILDSHKAQLYGQVFDNRVVHEDLAIHEGGEVAWAVRKNSPQLLAAVDAFAAKARKVTEIGNIFCRRRAADPARLLNAVAPDEEAKFAETTDFIRTHAAAYDFDTRATGYSTRRAAARTPADAARRACCAAHRARRSEVSQ